MKVLNTDRKKSSAFKSGFLKPIPPTVSVDHNGEWVSVGCSYTGIFSRKKVQVHQRSFQTSEDPPDVIRIAFAADVIKRERQLILVVWLDIGRIKNKNKNPVAERAVQELEEELLKQESGGGPIDQVSLAIAVARLNARLRRQGLSSRELWTQRSQFTGNQLPVADYNTILAKYQQRLNNHSSSEHAKNPRGLAPPEPQIKVGDLVYLVSDRNKLHARNRYLVTEINDPWCFVKKFSGCQLRASSYKVKLSECYVVPTQVNSPSSCVNQADDEVHDEQASVPDPPQPPLDITHPFDANPESLDTSIPLPQGDGGETLSDPKEPEVPRAPVEPDVSYSNPDESRAQPAPPRPQRSRKPPSYLKDYVMY
ncbi:hypothetical protein AWC38_SpisGene13038 [Stylophora pistillata]|uniref:Uncharacterized protein n=1 Tax=Stylophora pistillata TaxID=50429 RepID=A0A2B4S1J7_STYPI|nr:hypothetical protein AWC38_SpisGene13038 [Stylophora pistillata]